MSTNTLFSPLPSAVHSGWTPVSTGLPSCGDGRLFVGVNTAGYAGVFNDFVDIGGSLRCVYETAEDSVEILSDLSMWAVFHGPNATQAVQVEPVHADDAAVDALAAKMKAKLAKQRAKGYGGWDTPECSQQHLSTMLREHIAKGDPVDVANFCAFLAARGEGIEAEVQAEPVAWASPETLAALELHRDVNQFPAGGTVLAVKAGTATEPLYTAPQAQPADALDAAFEAVRKRFCKLPRYSFLLDGKGNVRRVPNFTGNWVEFEAAHTLFDPAAVEAAMAAAQEGGNAAKEA